jgi:O-antigen ligase
MKFLRFGICLLVAFSVIALGVVDVWSESIFELGAAALFVLWGFLVVSKQVADIRWSPLNWPLLGLLVIALAQLGLHRTVYPYLTKVELLKLTAAFLIFFLTAQAFRERRDFVAFVWFIVSFGFVIALFGIAQHFSSNGKIYWVLPVPEGGTFFGPYVNVNHFAGFVELTAPLGLALLAFRGLRRDLVPLAGLLTAVPIAALILTGSRGGILSFLFEIGFLVLLVWNLRARKARAGAFAIVVLAAGTLIAWLGAGKAMERFTQLRPEEVTLARRWSMFKGSARIFLAHPIAGTGLATLVVVYPKYETMYDGRLVDHSHDDYIEMLADLGILGGLCAFAFLYLLFRSAFLRFACEQSHFSLAFHAGALAACAGILLHSFVDFNLHIPANFMLFLLQSCLAASPCLDSEGPDPSRRSSAVTFSTPRYGHWIFFLILSSIIRLNKPLQPSFEERFA